MEGTEAEYSIPAFLQSAAESIKIPETRPELVESLSIVMSNLSENTYFTRQPYETHVPPAPFEMRQVPKLYWKEEPDDVERKQSVWQANFRLDFLQTRNREKVAQVAAVVVDEWHTLVDKYEPEESPLRDENNDFDSGKFATDLKFLMTDLGKTAAQSSKYKGTTKIKWYGIMWFLMLCGLEFHLTYVAMVRYATEMDTMTLNLQYITLQALRYLLGIVHDSAHPMFIGYGADNAKITVKIIQVTATRFIQLFDYMMQLIQRMESTVGYIPLMKPDMLGAAPMQQSHPRQKKKKPRSKTKKPRPRSVKDTPQ